MNEGNGNGSNPKRLGRFVVQEELALVLSGKASRSQLDDRDAFRAGLLNHLLYKAQIKDGLEWLDEERQQKGETNYGWIDVTRQQLAEETLNQRDIRSIGMHLEEIVKAGYLASRKPKRVNHYRVALRRLCQDLLDRDMEMDARKIGGQEYGFQLLCREFGLKRRTARERLADALTERGIDPVKVGTSMDRLVEKIQGELSEEDTEEFLGWIAQKIVGLASGDHLKAILNPIFNDPMTAVETWREKI